MDIRITIDATSEDPSPTKSDDEVAGEIKQAITGALSAAAERAGRKWSLSVADVNVDLT